MSGGVSTGDTCEIFTITRSRHRVNFTGVFFVLLAVLSAIASIFSPAALALPALWIVAANFRLGKPTPNKQHLVTDPVQQEEETTASCPVVAAPRQTRLYRDSERKRVEASLKAAGQILICGEDGSGKSILAESIVDGLREEGFTVAYTEPATPKQMLVEICSQLDIDTVNLEGKALNAEQLKRAIATYFSSNTAFLVVDDAHLCENRFRVWLKELKRQGVPMLLAATDPPRTDVFINLPRIELKPLPEYAIREILEQEALERGLSLKPHELAKLQSRAGGNPMLAIRVIEEEYLGVEAEAGDHRRYYDATPLILLAGIAFVATRFFALGTNNPALYVITGMAGAVFMGISRLLYNLPREGRRIS